MKSETEKEISDAIMTGFNTQWNFRVDQKMAEKDRDAEPRDNVSDFVEWDEDKGGKDHEKIEDILMDL